MSLDDEHHLDSLHVHAHLEIEEDEEDEADIGVFHAENIEDSPKKGKRKRDAGLLRKAPQAPKRFKSSYICFFMAKQPEIKKELGEEGTVTAISKRSAEIWKNLSPEERAHWDDVAAKDKQRYMVEKASYTGPWQVPWKRSRKDPSAPKRPMSAFLYFSQGKRGQIKQEHPDMKNTEVSRLLGEMWRKATEEERRPHIDTEKGERDKYKVAIAEWRTANEAKQESQRRAQAEQIASLPQGDVPPYTDSFGVPTMGHAGPYGMYSPYQYSYPPGPYQFPTNGKQPVILNLYGTPHYAANYTAPPTQGVAATPSPAATSGPAPAPFPNPPGFMNSIGLAPPESQYDFSDSHRTG